MEKFLSCQIAMYEVPEANSWFKQVRVAGKIIAFSKVEKLSQGLPSIMTTRQDMKMEAKFLFSQIA